MGTNNPGAIGLLGSLSVSNQTPVGYVPVSNAVLWNQTTSGSTLTLSTKDASGNVYYMSYSNMSNGSQLFVSTANTNNQFALIDAPSMTTPIQNPIYLCGSLDKSTCSNSVVQWDNGTDVMMWSKVGTSP
jgi:hypothetical protein